MKPWVITWGEESWTDLDATAGDLIAVVEQTGRAVGFDVSPWDGPNQLGSWIVVLESRRRAKLNPEADAAAVIGQVMAEIYQTSAEVLLNALQPRLADVAPSGPLVDATPPDLLVV